MNLDINQLLNAVAEGKISVNDANYILNTAARFIERTSAENETH